MAQNSKLSNTTNVITWLARFLYVLEGRDFRMTSDSHDLNRQTRYTITFEAVSSLLCSDHCALKLAERDPGDCGSV